MAYQAKRKKIYEEEFQLVEEDGTVVHTLHVQMDADNMLKKLCKKHLALVQAMENIRNVQQAVTEEEKQEGIQIMEEAVKDMVEAVFGKEDTRTIIEFYDNRYLELCQEVVPFIVRVIVPEIKKIAQENKKELLSGYAPRKWQAWRKRKK